jgi:uncharacterized repeat protein (TIGR01451 family)
VTDTLPTDVSFTSTSGSDWTCDPVVGQTLTCTATAVKNGGESYTPLVVSVDVVATAPTSVANTAAVSTVGDLNTANDSTTISTSVIQVPDLVIANTPSGEFKQGQVGATYLLTVTNQGTGLTSGTITVTDTLPTKLTPTAVSGGANWTCDPVSGQTVTCTTTATQGQGGAFDPITVTVDVARDTSSPQINVASSSGGGELAAQQGNNTTNDTTSITQMPDLTIAKAAVGTFRQGLDATYTLTVTNAGFADTSGTVTVTDTLPTGMTFVSGIGTGWTCSAVGQDVTCTTTTVQGAGQPFAPITLTVHVADDALTSLTNTAIVAGGGEIWAPNNDSTIAVPIEESPDLKVGKSHAANFSQGMSGAPYTIVVTNAGPGTTAGQVTVTDTLPTGLTYAGSTGTGWTCTAAGQVVTCETVETRGPSLSFDDLTITVDVSTTAAPSVTNAVAVAGGSEVASLRGNNSSTDPTNITQFPDLSITKNHALNFHRGQKNAPYILTVTNIGQVATTGTVTVTDTLPLSGLTAAAISGTGWTCDLALLTCTRSDVLAAGASYPSITVKVDVKGNSPNLVTNQATVSTAGEVHLDNNAASDATNIVPAPPPPIPPFVTIIAPTTDTRETTITVSGLANPFAVIDVNGASVQVDVLGKWHAVVALIEGPNVILATNATASAMVTVNRDTQPPAIRLTASQDRTTAEEVDLLASSEPGAKIEIEGKEGTTLRVHLQLGDNTFTATATDRAGNTATATVTVVRVAPDDHKAPELNDLPEKVTKPSLTVSGKGTVGTTVTLIVNGTTQTSATVDAGGRFSLNATLAVGKNVLSVKGIDGLTSKEATVEYQPPCTDLNGHWAATAFMRMYELGVVKGYEDNTCRPEVRVTRLEFAVMVARLLKLAPVDGPLIFTDSDQIPTWAKAQVAAAVKAGIITGRPDGSFDPSASVTRAEMAVMLVRALRFSGLDTTPGNATFADEIPAWAKDYVAAAARYGLVTGYQDGTFRPGNLATRAEAVTMLSRLLDVIAK